MSEQRIVIVGAGQGGLQAAMSLRQEGHTGPITLIGAEPGLPYQRPPLSKAFLKTGKVEKLTLRPQTFFDKNDITYVPQTQVDAIDRTACAVRAGDRRFDYDHLILATGTRNLSPPIDGVERALDLRTLKDAENLRAALERPRRIAVIGGGFIGLEFAAVALELGHQVTVAEATPRLMARAVSRDMSKRFHDLHIKLGAQMHLNANVSRVTDNGLVLAAGTRISADMVLLAAGVRPNTEIATDAGLAVANGIVVNTKLLTADPKISALGDCAAFPDPNGGAMIRLESVQAATDQARAIAKRIVKDDPSPYSAVPWFWSDQADWKLQIAGLAGPDDIAVAVGANTVLRFSGSHLTAVETINNAKTHMKARRVLVNRPGPTHADLQAVGFDLTAL
jgi:3-phenylpropionate/trans-cinnamate dioxygenase ferredoxin reductase component